MINILNCKRETHVIISKRFIAVFRLAILTFGIAFLFANCTSSINSSIGLEIVDPVVGPFWPPAPQPARVEFISNSCGQLNIGVKKTWFQNALESIFGSETKTFTLLRPYGVAVVNDKIYVTDPGLGLIHVFDKNRQIILQINEAGGEILRSPIGVAVDANGEIYSTDSYLRKVFVFDREGKYSRQIGSTNKLERPTGIAILENKIYVVDTLGHKVLVFSKHDGMLMASFGKNGVGAGDFNYPTNIFIGKDRNVYIMDSMNFRVQVFNEEGKYLFSFGKHGDGTGDFSKPKGIAVDSEGHIYVSDADFDNIQIFNRDGRLLLVVGSTGTGKGEMSLPAGIFIDRQDRIYVADSYNRRIQIFQYLKQNAVR
jgi:DNA-binding beta-propeller fold protein YncE